MICKHCQQEMNDKVSCNGNTDSLPWNEANGAIHCHDCYCPPGGFHHPGCDAERCPTCFGQRISCDCDRNDPVLTDQHYAAIDSIREYVKQKLSVGAIKQSDGDRVWWEPIAEFQRIQVYADDISPFNALKGHAIPVDTVTDYRIDGANLMAEVRDCRHLWKSLPCPMVEVDLYIRESDGSELDIN